GSLDDLVDGQVGPDGAPAAADDVALVGLVTVQSHAILLAVDRDGADAELGGGAKHADGDLAAVRAKQLANRAVAHVCPSWCSGGDAASACNAHGFAHHGGRPRRAHAGHWGPS